MSEDTGIIEIAVEVDLPPSSYDGSHLPWKSYRQHVLGPHRIRVAETAPKEKLPATLLAMIEGEMPNAARFDDLKESFREQVVMGRQLVDIGKL